MYVDLLLLCHAQTQRIPTALNSMQSTQYNGHVRCTQLPCTESEYMHRAHCGLCKYTVQTNGAPRHTALTFSVLLYGYRATCRAVHVAHAWHLHYANDVGSHSSMQSIEHCTGCRTKLYAVRACCTVCNTHDECLCKAMAEWVMFEADLWNADSLSSANFFSARALR